MAIVENIAASILEKLRNKTKKSNISYQQTLQLFVQEEFLIFHNVKSPYKNYNKRICYKNSLVIFLISI